MEPVDTMEVLLKISEGNRAVALKNKRKPQVKQKKEEKTQKKIKVEAETESSIKHERKIKHEKTEASSDTSKETSKGASEIQKLDYITVRARRGQATDIHNLAERVRREKISKKMKYLQDIVPVCNKVTEKAGMLDEIINYVQCLQRQAEFLSMKLAVLNPELELALEDVSVKEVKAHSVDHQNDIVIAQQLKGYEISISGLLYKCSCVEDSKQPIMVDVPLFPLDQQGSLDLSAIPNQTTSIEVTSIYETENLSNYSEFLFLVSEVTRLLCLSVSTICKLGNSVTKSLQDYNTSSFGFQY